MNYLNGRDIVKCNNIHCNNYKTVTGEIIEMFNYPRLEEKLDKRYPKSFKERNRCNYLKEDEHE